ncbi:MAG: LysE family translocator [Chloroflexota bacterium]|nr:LysE family translocator [Chloroflexota bacterium]
MPEWGTLSLFLFAAFALVATPGPSVLYVVARSMDQGRGAGIASAFGIQAGTLVHVVAAVIGISALVASSATAFAVVKYLGAAYLIYMGIRTLTRKIDVAAEMTPRTPQPPRRIFFQGLVVEALNPKTVLFFLAFLPQFVDPARGSVATQTLILGALLAMIGLLSDTMYALIAGTAGALLHRNKLFARTQRYVSGGVYLGLGATTALMGSRDLIQSGVVPRATRRLGFRPAIAAGGAG